MNRTKHLRWVGVLLLVVAILVLVGSQATLTLPVEAGVLGNTATVSSTAASFTGTTAPMAGEGLGKLQSGSGEIGTEAVGSDRKAGAAVSLSTSTFGVGRNAGTLGLPPQSQNLGTAGGLTVSAVGSVTWPADEAYVILVPELYYGPSGPEQITSKDKQEVIDSLAELGIAESAIEFSTFRRYDPSAIRVEMELEGLSEKADQVIEAVQETIRHIETYGVFFKLSPEHCAQALAQARRHAIPRAQQAADDLAEAFSIELGGVISVLEHSGTHFFNLSGTSVDVCNPQGLDPYPEMVAFDAEPEVEVVIGLQVTYQIQ